MGYIQASQISKGEKFKKVCQELGFNSILELDNEIQAEKQNYSFRIVYRFKSGVVNVKKIGSMLPGDFTLMNELENKVNKKFNL